MTLKVYSVISVFLGQSGIYIFKQAQYLSVHFVGLSYHPQWVSLSPWPKLYSWVSLQENLENLTFSPVSSSHRGTETGCMIYFCTVFFISSAKIWIHKKKDSIVTKNETRDAVNIWLFNEFVSHLFSFACWNIKFLLSIFFF